MRLATSTNTSDLGKVGARMLAFYSAVARGGAGTIVSESLRVHGSNFGRNDYSLLMYQADIVPGVTALADAVHAEGALLIGQLNHGGRQHHSPATPMLWAPSAIACPHSGNVPHEMTLDEIEQLIAGFVTAAAHAQLGGMDGVEIHGAQGHLIQEFVSPFSNQRSDEFGGSFEKRMRFPREIIRRVRERVGRDFIVGYRLGVEEFTAGGLTLDDAKRIAREFAAAGLIDYLSLAQGNFNSIETHCPGLHFAPVPYADLHAQVKAVAGSLPVVASSRIQTPEQAEALLAEGKADIIGLCRALLADPEWPAKAASGRSNEIRRCAATSQCWGWIVDRRPIACSINPALGRELDLPPLAPAPRRKRVVVAGGGPAGLEAARIAAQRGHEVIVLEKSPAVGGKLAIDPHAPAHYRERAAALQFLAGEIERSQVTVHANTPATAAAIAQFRPDAVIVATGADPIVPQLPGDGSVPVVTSFAALTPEQMRGKHGVVMDEDGYLWAAEAAETAALKFAQITFVTRQMQPLREVPVITRIPALSELDRLGATVKIMMFVDRIEDGEVVLKHVRTGREQRIANAGAVIWVGRQRANDGLAAQLRAAGIEQVHLIGDALAPRRLYNAISEGHGAGRAV
jgi:2,4-dienoyl-CoA reductase-like NADH-dependent reductase (Old Yellow Enzyme family)/thioredoxin reductase